MRSVLRIAAWIYAGVMAAGIAGNIWVAATTAYGVRLTDGCYHYDAMLVGVACRGFVGAALVERFLMTPFFLLYLPVLTWVPFIYLGVSYYKQRQRLIGAPN